MPSFVENRRELLSGDFHPRLLQHLSFGGVGRGLTEVDPSPWQGPAAVGRLSDHEDVRSSLDHRKHSRSDDHLGGDISVVTAKDRGNAECIGFAVTCQFRGDLAHLFVALNVKGALGERETGLG